MYSEVLPVNRYGYNKYVLEDCIKNIALGDKDALSLLYEMTRVSVYGFALSILKNVHEAEDVLQEVYIKIYNSASTYKSSGKPIAWILTITKNLSLMRLRKERYVVDIDEIIETISSDRLRNDALNRVLVDIVFKHISLEERNILILYVLLGYKHREIALILDIPLSTVLSKYNRCIKKIRKLLSEEG